MPASNITVAIPHLPERGDMLTRALDTVRAQTLQPDKIVVLTDTTHPGEAVLRNRLVAAVHTEWVAWLDDDDELLPHHLAALAAVSADADVVYSDYEVIGGDHRPSFIQANWMARVSAIRNVGGFPEPFGLDWPYRYADWGLLAKLLNVGYRFRYVPEKTWRYNIHSSNSVGAGF